MEEGKQAKNRNGNLAAPHSAAGLAWLLLEGDNCQEKRIFESKPRDEEVGVTPEKWSGFEKH
jgi:hypothetical protein